MDGWMSNIIISILKNKFTLSLSSMIENRCFSFQQALVRNILITPMMVTLPPTNTQPSMHHKILNGLASVSLIITHIRLLVPNRSMNVYCQGLINFTAADLQQQDQATLKFIYTPGVLTKSSVLLSKVILSLLSLQIQTSSMLRHPPIFMLINHWKFRILPHLICPI